MPRWRIVAFVALLSLAGLLAWILRSSPVPAGPAPVRAPATGSPAVEGAPAPQAPAPRAEMDPMLRRWQAAVVHRNREEVVSLQTAFQVREGEYRDGLMRMAREDLEPRVRAFTVTLLGRFKTGPEEAFFLERLGDPQDFAREAALGALERCGTAAGLPAVDRLAASDPSEGVRSRAAAVAKLLRSK
jgi:hypothetical protein